ncbi:MAG: 16S rRNA (adenine(1518)-N(6)/adenine(1519)-N(6))-dimethyltransferase RsmA [Desulfovibrio sp.]|jgi:16S rRNA (adenine1518-N6/adenine1519-N6)-dimethyltransferase|nr:16S rRNA (adenine(1518)-N(6)/adenine(1519)-N(6))-dimethyltransferase RsmA [Desulfovibrio sp.]
MGKHSAVPGPPGAKKSLGQHFLREISVCPRISDLLALRPEDRLLEIGPGSGALTRELEKAPHSLLLLLEKDDHWIAERGRLRAPGTLPVHADALFFDWRRITPKNSWKIAGNLPYNIASRLIWDIVWKAEGLARAVFMVQHEVGRRITAPPSGRHYGALSVWVQSFARPRLEFTVGPEAFVPPPKVLSAVISLEPLPPYGRPRRPEILAGLLRTCFRQRRKQLGTIFRRAGMPEFVRNLQGMGIDPVRRPETLTPKNFRQLCETVEQSCFRSQFSVFSLKKSFAFTGSP